MLADSAVQIQDPKFTFWRLEKEIEWLRVISSLVLPTAKTSVVVSGGADCVSILYFIQYIVAFCLALTHAVSPHRLAALLLLLHKLSRGFSTEGWKLAGFGLLRKRVDLSPCDNILIIRTEFVITRALQHVSAYCISQCGLETIPRCCLW